MSLASYLSWWQLSQTVSLDAYSTSRDAPKDNYTFEEGRDYVRMEQRKVTLKPVLAAVEFIDYDPCPAYIIVRDKVGKKYRCLRDDLFTQVSHL